MTSDNVSGLQGVHTSIFTSMQLIAPSQITQTAHANGVPHRCSSVFAAGTTEKIARREFHGEHDLLHGWLLLMVIYRIPVGPSQLPTDFCG